MEERAMGIAAFVFVLAIVLLFLINIMFGGQDIVTDAIKSIIENINNLPGFS